MVALHHSTAAAERNAEMALASVNAARCSALDALLAAIVSAIIGVAFLAKDRLPLSPMVWRAAVGHLARGRLVLGRSLLHLCR
jgi:hypothetical protein